MILLFIRNFNGTVLASLNHRLTSSSMNRNITYTYFAPANRMAAIREVAHHHDRQHTIDSCVWLALPQEYLDTHHHGPLSHLRSTGRIR